MLKERYVVMLLAAKSIQDDAYPRVKLEETNQPRTREPPGVKILPHKMRNTPSRVRL